MRQSNIEFYLGSCLDQRGINLWKLFLIVQSTQSFLVKLSKCLVSVWRKQVCAALVQLLEVQPHVLEVMVNYDYLA